MVPAVSDVGAFTAQVTLAPLLNWTNRENIANISRTAPLTVTWENGQPGSVVSIRGQSTVVNPSGNLTASFECVAPVEARSLTVPQSVLLALPRSDPGTTVDVLKPSTLTITNRAATPFYASGVTYAFILTTIGVMRTVSFL